MNILQFLGQLLIYHNDVFDVVPKAHLNLRMWNNGTVPSYLYGLILNSVEANHNLIYGNTYIDTTHVSKISFVELSIV